MANDWKCVQCGGINPENRSLCLGCNSPRSDAMAVAPEGSAPILQTPAPAAQVRTVYDIENQYRRIAAYIIPGETLYAVYDCKGAGTGFVGISDQRVIFYDQGFFLKKKSMVSIPYHQVIGVASADEGIIFQTSELVMITAAGRFAFEFRGADKAHWAYQFILNQVMNRPNPQMRG
jgi:hypothetical protein